MTLSREAENIGRQPQLTFRQRLILAALAHSYTGHTPTRAEDAIRVADAVLEALAREYVPARACDCSPPCPQVVGHEGECLK